VYYFQKSKGKYNRTFSYCTQSQAPMEAWCLQPITKCMILVDSIFSHVSTQHLYNRISLHGLFGCLSHSLPCEKSHWLSPFLFLLALNQAYEFFCANIGPHFSFLGPNTTYQQSSYLYQLLNYSYSNLKIRV
jgi:hypothetical protein